MIAFVLNAQNNNQFLENRFRLAKSYEKAHKYDQAIEIYKDLLKTQPWNYKYIMALNNAFISIKDYDSSIKLLSDRVKQNPNDTNLYALIGKTYYTKGDYEKAFSIWDEALQIVNVNQVSYRIVANAAIEMRAFDKAAEIIKRAKEKYADTEMFLFDLANLYTVTMKYEEAVNEYCSLLISHPQHLALVKSRLIQILGNHGAAETAVKVVNNYFEETGNREFLGLLALIYIQTNEFEKAFEINKKLELEFDGNGTRMYGFAQTVYSENITDIALKAYEFILEHFPDSPIIPNVKLGYAKTLEKKTVLSYRNSPENWKPLVQKQNYNKQDFSRIIESYRELLRYYSNPENIAEIYFRIGLIYKNYLSDYDSSSFYFINCFKKYPLSSYAYKCKYELGREFIERKEFEKAEREFKGIIKEPRADKNLKSSAQFDLSKIYFWRGNFADAIAGLSEISKNLSDDNANDALQLSMMITILRQDSLTLLKFAKADMFISLNQLDSAAQILSGLSKKENLLIWNSYAKYNLAVILLAKHKIADAVNLLNELVQDEKPSLVKDKSLFLLGKIYQFGVKDSNKAIEQYQKLLENFPNSLYLDKARDFINSLQL